MPKDKITRGHIIVVVVAAIVAAIAAIIGLEIVDAVTITGVGEIISDIIVVVVDAITAADGGIW